MQEPTEASCKRLGDLVLEYGEILQQELGFDPITVHVLLFLFERKLFGSTQTYSSYSISRSLRIIEQLHLPLYESAKKRATPQNVSHSLGELESWGFVLVTTPANNHSDKGRGRSKDNSGGRPPNKLYQMKTSDEILKIINEKLDRKKRNLYEVFGKLGDWEEHEKLIKEKMGERKE